MGSRQGEHGSLLQETQTMKAFGYSLIAWPFMLLSGIAYYYEVWTFFIVIGIVVGILLAVLSIALGIMMLGDE